MLYGGAMGLHTRCICAFLVYKKKQLAEVERGERWTYANCGEVWFAIGSILPVAILASDELMDRNREKISDN